MKIVTKICFWSVVGLAHSVMCCFSGFMDWVSMRESGLARDIVTIQLLSELAIAIHSGL